MKLGGHGCSQLANLPLPSPSAEAVSQTAAVAAGGGGGACVWRNVLTGLMSFPPALTLLQGVSCYLSESDSASFFHTVSVPLSPLLPTSQWKLCVSAFVFRTSEASSDGLSWILSRQLLPFPCWAKCVFQRVVASTCAYMCCLILASPVSSRKEKHGIRMSNPPQLLHSTLLFLRASIKTEALQKCGLP